jgi:hypothetical protein
MGPGGAVWALHPLQSSHSPLPTPDTGFPFHWTIFPCIVTPYPVGWSDWQILMPPCYQVFREQGIDGETLPLLTEEHLLTTMGLKLGPALKIRAQVSRLAPDNAGEDTKALHAGDSPTRPLSLAGTQSGSSLCRWPSASVASSTWPTSLWPCRYSQAFKPLSS